jgi:putative ABC transport system substrate-binding protein
MAARVRLIAILALGFLCASSAAWGQQPGKVARIGYLGNTPGPLVDAFRQGLRDLGWIEGRNLLIELRWAQGRSDRLPEFADELVRLKVDLILAQSSTYVEPARRATSTIPIVFGLHADPVGTGHVASLARPGGNVTGLSVMQTELGAKGLELLKEAVPAATRIAVLWSRDTPSHGPGLKAVEAAGRSLALQLLPIAAQRPAEFDGAFASMVRERAQALLVLTAPVFGAEAKQLAERALKHHLPTMFGLRQNVEAGGLMSYGPDFSDLMRRSAVYVDKILKGAKPADLPVEQASKFELVLNLKTAQALGLTPPQSVLLRADQVIR